MIQQTEEWFKERLGKATTSRFGDIVSKNKNGTKTAGWKNYKAELIAERLVKNPITNGYTNASMQWGVDNEPVARLVYELITGNKVEEVFFVNHKTLKAGSSPDGFIGKDGTTEIKCPNTSNHIAILRSGKMPSQYIPQVQGQLWISKRKWCDFVSFDPRLPKNAQIIIIRVERDDDYINNVLEPLIINFLSEVDEEERFIKEYGQRT